MTLRIHAVEPASHANGPGLRAVVWFQGCTIGCPNCFNPETHDPTGGQVHDPESLAAEILALRGIDGVSISGGEPFQQPEALAELVARLRPSGLSLLIFSGYTLEAIRAMPLGPAVLGSIDVLIAGPYVTGRHLGRGLLGSANQLIHLLTGRHRMEEFLTLPRTEAIVHKDGTVTLTGIEPLTIARAAGDPSV